MRTERRLRLVADDLTGALDSAAAFAAPSDPVVVSWSDAVPLAGSFALSTETREVSAAQARARTLAAADRVARGDGDAIVFKKLDSLLRGHPVIELAAMIERLAPDRVVLAPAHPGLGRVTRGGRQHVLDPTTGRVELVGVDLASGLRDLGFGVSTEAGVAPGTPPVLMADAESRADLLAVVERERSRGGRILWCGSGGLAEVLAEAPAGGEGQRHPVPSGTTLAVIGSDHAVAAAQIRTVADLDPGALVRLRPDGSVEEVAATVNSSLAARPVTLVVPQLAPMSRETAGRAIAGMLTALLPRLTRPDVLYCSGGETLRAACDALGAGALLCEGFVAPGIPLGRLRDGAWAGLPVLSKSGAFGTAATLAALLGMGAPHSDFPPTPMRDGR